jgi:hypothetical protein
MNHRIRLVALAAGFAVPVILAAQAPAAPKVMVIGRELVKPGKDAAHAKLETAWSRSLEAAKYPTTLLAMTTMSGASEVWFLNPYASMADMQKVNEAYEASAALTAVGEKYRPQESDLLTNSFTMITTLRDDLSYSSGTPLPSLRYMTLQRVSVKIGHNDEFVEARKIIKAAHEQAKASDGYAIYQVTAGAPAGTFLIFRGLKSLAELDANPHGPEYMAAMGGPEGQKKLNTMLMSYENSADLTAFQFSPAMSSPGKAWTDADPYWKPKAAAKKAP